MATQKSVYVLGTGLSHNGSTVLQKDGKVLPGMEKERLSRQKHDGFAIPNQENKLKESKNLKECSHIT